ncbi:MAG TPA: isoamylase early set domain-containing protein [Gemmatimonadaceae bacterium]|nr:isoamylase early set domain-containing protein [Gemmatimonadaceae bacterium]
MEHIARGLRGPVPVSSGVDDRVMAAVRRMPRHSRSGLWARLTTPRTITVTPLTWGLLAASVLLFAGIGIVREYEVLDRAAAPLASALFPKPAQPVRAQPVQFVLVAPGAKKVAVAGDFNGWDPTHEAYQAKQRGGGVWSVTAPVPPGHHRYSFVVDDSVWVADPTAPRALDDDYGMPNSAIVVEDNK